MLASADNSFAADGSDGRRKLPSRCGGTEIAGIVAVVEATAKRSTGHRILTDTAANET